MGRPDYIFGQFRETARCRDAQHGGGVCCVFAPRLVIVIIIIIILFRVDSVSLMQKNVKIDSDAVVLLNVVLLMTRYGKKIKKLNLPSRSRYSFTDSERMEG